MQGHGAIRTDRGMTAHYALYKKSCTNSSGYIPVKATDHELFTAPLYLMPVAKYRTTVKAKVFYTLSKGGKHLTSLFQSKPGPYYGDIFNREDALLVFMEGLTMEIFVFPGQRNFAEAFAANIEKLPLADIRLRARPVHSEKYTRQLLCYAGKQLSFT